MVHTNLRATVLSVVITFVFASVAPALTGTYVVLTKGGGGLALFFTEKGTFTSVAVNPRTKRKHYAKGKYTASGNQLTMTTSTGKTGTMTVEPNGELRDNGTDIRFHRYNRRR